MVFLFFKNMKSTLIISLLVTYVTLSQGRFLYDSLNPLIEFDRVEQLDQQCRVSWHVNTDTKTVIFEVVAQTPGWVGFGISKFGAMPDSDLIMGGMDGGRSYFTDRHTVARSEPLIDAVQNWELISASESSGVTILKFQRAFDTGDATDDIPIEDADVAFIWALGATDNTTTQHVSRGSFPVNILRADALTFNKTSPSPSTSTTESYSGSDFVRSYRFNENFTATWQVYADLNRIVFEVEANTTGWVAFGISESGTMTNADVIMGGIHDDKTPYFSDRFSAGHGEPEVDAEQNWEFLEGRESENRTYLRFVRDFETTDSVEDINIADKRTYFVWAIGASDNTSGKHTSRGSYRLNILQAETPLNFVRTEVLSENLTASWDVDYVSDSIIFEVWAKTTGYIGFGLSESGTMSGADLIIGGVNDDLSPYFEDRFSEKHGVPAIDAEQNWILLAAREDANVTYLRFIRNFDTGDVDNDFPILDRDTYFIWAVGTTDNITKHAYRGSFLVNILEPSTPPTATTTEAPPIPDNFVRQVQINENLTVEWTADFQNKIITFETTALTTGYIGFGIADSGSMANADLIIGGVDENGVSYFNDRFATRHGVPSIDTYQNWFLLSASESNTTTRLRFTRGFDTGDTIGDYPIEDRQTNFIWAIGSSDNLQRHATRGAYPVNILEPPTSVPGTSSTEGSTCDDVYKREEELSTTIPFAVSWEVDSVKSYITFEVTAETTGFVGFGFSESGTMENADLVFGGVKDGNVYFHDMFASQNGAPTEDTENNWDLISGREDTRTTTLKFGRNIATSDTVQDRPIENKETYFIWATGATDDLNYHSTNRGNFRVNILQCENGNGLTGSTSVTTTEVPPIPENFVRRVEINENLTVEWAADFQNKLITFETIVLTTGYIGFGISDTGTMANADLIIGGVGENGVAYFNDRFATRHGVPNIDVYQNWFLLSASESNTTTTLRFTRGFDTGDTIGDYPIEDRQTYFIWAIGSSDDIQKHAIRGAYEVNILEPPVGVPGVSTEPSACDSVYRREEELSTTIPFAVKWEVDSAKSYITFEVTADTTGFVGFGFSESGTMENADLVYGGVKDGNGYLKDMFASQNGAPTEDTESNWDLISGREDTRTTTLKFGRSTVTSDTVQDRPIEDKETYFIWATGATDDLDYHSTNRGNFRVNILECENGNGPSGSPTISTTPSSGGKNVISLALLTLTLFLFLY